MPIVAVSASSIRIVALASSFGLLVGTVTIPPFLVPLTPEIVLELRLWSYIMTDLV
jgi:hypothetical protein